MRAGSRDRHAPKESSVRWANDDVGHVARIRGRVYALTLGTLTGEHDPADGWVLREIRDDGAHLVCRWDTQRRPALELAETVIRVHARVPHAVA